MRVVFMGTPDIAATCLKQVLRDGFDVVGVYTQPDRPKNRGMKLAFSPVKEVALAAGLPVHQPENFRAPETVEQLRQLRPDVIAVVAYGRLLPQSVLDIPPKGCINIHASLLPAYRGSAPYQWAVLDGAAETGVTAMYLIREMDAGDIIAQAATPIDLNENVEQLHDRLAVMGAELLGKVVKAIADGTAPRTPQDESQYTYAPMLSRDMSPIDWSHPALDIHNQIRGLVPWPATTMELAGTKFKVFAAFLTGETSDQPAGTALGADKKGIRMVCGDGQILCVTEVQAPGKKRMKAVDYLRGHPIF